jgi:hypothetical protein
MSLEHLELIDRLTPRFTHYSASELGIENVDLSATAGTQHKSVALDFSGVLSLYIYISYHDEGSAGVHKLQWEVLDDSSAAVVTDDITENKSTASGSNAKVLFPPGVAPIGVDYTLDTDEGDYTPISAPRGRLVVNVVTPSEGTDAILSAQIAVVTRGQASPTPL